MKELEFKDGSAKRIYQSYIERCLRVLKPLNQAAQVDAIMDINSYIYEYMDHNKDLSEMTSLLNILDRVGPPEETLKEVVAMKKIDEAVSTYNVKHVFQALYYNARNGTLYFIFGLTVVLFLTFPFTIFMKIFYPEDVGLFIGNGSFFIGTSNDDPAIKEHLGNWFIPVILLISVVFYYLLIQLLKFIRKSKLK